MNRKDANRRTDRQAVNRKDADRGIDRQAVNRKDAEGFDRGSLGRHVHTIPSVVDPS